jgi:magnesium-transporting ATPase (P-type)
VIQGLTEQEVVERKRQGLGNPTPPPTTRTLRDILRAQRTLDRIALLNRPRALVLRRTAADAPSAEQSVDPGDLVKDDVLVLQSGEQVMLDGVVVEGGAEVDESLLTGESDLMHKVVNDKVMSGSFCVTGRALYRAEKVGMDSYAQSVITLFSLMAGLMLGLFVSPQFRFLAGGRPFVGDKRFLWLVIGLFAICLIGWNIDPLRRFFAMAIPLDSEVGWCWRSRPCGHSPCGSYGGSAGPSG